MLLSLVSVAYAAAMTIPDRYPGIVYGDTNPLVHLEIYADPLCSVCAYFWPTVKEILEAYPKNLKTTVHFLPLPYHTWAFVMTKAILAVDQISRDKAKTLMDNIFLSDQEKFDLPSKSQDEVIQIVAKYVEDTLSISQTDFLSKFYDAESDARIEFKFAASNRVNGTPICFLNGVETDLGAGTPLATWQQTIDALINA